MSNTETDKFRVLVTAIIRNEEGKLLLTRRADHLKRWPGKWTVPGGHMTTEDFLGKPTPINNQWYNTLENALRREVHEETKLNIGNIKYLCNIAIPDAIIVSYTADIRDSSVSQPILDPNESSQYAWVTPQEAEGYDLIDGLLDEILWSATHPPSPLSPNYGA